MLSILDRLTATKLLSIISAALLLASTARADDAAKLPDPDGKSADMSKPVQVYILLGQSNMLGFGKVNPSRGKAEGSLTHAVKEKNKYPYLIDEEGNWTERKDVRNVRVMGSGTGAMRVHNNEWMTIKGGNIGPEIGIGHHVGEVTDAPVLILKSCIGNRSLGWDLLPPGSPSFEFQEKDKKTGELKTWHYAGYKETPLRWEKGTKPEPIGWYAGMQYDGDIARAKNVLSEFDKYYPGVKKAKVDTARVALLSSQIAEKEDFARRARFTQEGLQKHNAEVAALRTELAAIQAAANGYEIAGFFFWQGDKDRYNAGHAGRYEQNLVHLINQLRKDFEAPNAKFVCATLGQTEKGAEGNEGLILNAQLAVDGKAGKYEEFKGNVATVYSHPLSQGGASNSHYGGNAETYMNIGEAMGKAMVELLEKNGPRKKYVSPAVLSEEQEKIVLELAAKRGIKSVAEIATYNLYPTAARGIAVKGSDQIIGREVSNQILHIRFKDWWHPGQAPRKDDLQIGDFWAGKPATQKQTILKIDGKEYRTGSVNGLSIEESESVLARLLGGKYSAGAGIQKSSLQQVDWSRPQFFRKSGDVLSVGFIHKNGDGMGFFELAIKLDGEELAIQQVLQAVP
jgi:hypothetical protein